MVLSGSGLGTSRFRAERYIGGRKVRNEVVKMARWKRFRGIRRMYLREVRQSGVSAGVGPGGGGWGVSDVLVHMGGSCCFRCDHVWSDDWNSVDEDGDG